MTVDEYLAPFSLQVQGLAHALRQRVKQIVPTVEERTYTGWQIIGLRVHHGNRSAQMGYLNAHENFMTIGFQFGALLPDPTQLLEDENLKRVRFVTLRHLKDIQNPALANLIEQAADVALMPKAMRDSLRR